MSSHNVIKHILHEFKPTGSASINFKAALQSWANLDPKKAMKNA